MQNSTQNTSQHVYSIEDTEILLLSEEQKGTKPEYNLTHLLLISPQGLCTGVSQPKAHIPSGPGRNWSHHF